MIFVKLFSAGVQLVLWSNNIFLFIVSQNPLKISNTSSMAWVWKPCVLWHRITQSLVDKQYWPSLTYQYQSNRLALVHYINLYSAPYPVYSHTFSSLVCKSKLKLVRSSFFQTRLWCFKKMFLDFYSHSLSLIIVFPAKQDWKEKTESHIALCIVARLPGDVHQENSS